jgi:hypothetical protein
MMLSESTQRGLIVLFSAVLAACGGGGGSASAPAPSPPPPAPTPPPPPPPGVAVAHTVTVTDTDAAMDTSFGAHLAYVNPSVSAKGKLFLFFPATASIPSRYTLIETAAADLGFHSLGLAYVNGPSPVETLCGASADPDCAGEIREEQFSGTDSSTLVSVSAADSVQNRVLKALIYLQNTYPTEGWGQYLNGSSSVRWDLVRVSGLSQGGGMAGYIAKQKQSVDRACFFSSPADWDDTSNQPATWVMSGTHLTAASRIYGFNNLKDPVVPYAHIKQTWTAFGLDPLGAAVSVDSASPPYGNTHELTTNLLDTLSAHTSTASDGNTPKDSNGNPVYLPVWTYACFN